ncbi:MAG: 6-phosphogluconolactonase [Phycisphaerales bacterium]|nr:6-phosphogluconolactonase [Phycisphaerales bacterium]
MQKATIIVCPDVTTLSRKAAERFIAIGKSAIAARGQFSVALAGGSTPETMYANLASPEMLQQLDWTKTFIFMSDERHVLPSDPRSNYGMALRTLLCKISPDKRHVFPVPTQHPTAAEAAAAYQRDLTNFFSASPDIRFDLILLGLGSDGHTASLFPHSAALNEKTRLVADSPPGTLPPPVERITFTYPLLNAAREILVRVAGEAKAAPLRRILVDGVGREECPAAGLHPSNGTLSYFIDTAAAAMLPSTMLTKL